ncbi:hypothetical protein GCM10008018_45850 [Paenibacillus marchantiophytorum]|uniref:Thiamine-binding protein domain-containing protein n=1 Tax=Paenibacillus marchantiophytorum TaxID=1619310 RepID=A0ABQ1EZJ5_9BACL|nr:MTH1187 family thiamine-binding protein [Paenibacillus marchantiophytorum]GFZ94351.1 hypothetical protein GCM10008018_45850 [Paenibacillus marchantiophytorum]
MAIAEFTIIPIGTATTSLSSYVADLHKELEKHTDITFQMTPMGTILEGSLDRVLAVIRAVHEVPFTNGAERVSTSIKIDDRRDKPASMQQKMQSVTDKLK